MNTIVQARMFMNKEKDQAKYFTNFTKTDLTLYLKSKCEKEFGIYFTHKNWKKITEFQADNKIQVSAGKSTNNNPELKTRGENDE